ncbi:TorF family putative porin [Amnimonas aquatica]|nr:TorF family putative porin [Amnimonas aquatica]
MKLSKLSRAVVAASLLATGAAAHAEITTAGSVAFTSDYKYRGISQTSSGPAVQGGLTLSHDSGLYAALWGSSINFADSGLELDPSVGYAFSAGGLDFDVGVLQYGYPGSKEDDLAFTEVYGSVAYAGAKLGVAYSPNFFGASGKATYTYVSYGTEVGGLGLTAYVGYQTIEDNATYGAEDYIDYKLALSKEVSGLTFEVAYIGTDLSDKDFGGDATDKDGKVIATVSKAF